MKAQIHWNQQKKMWTIHTYKGCEWATHIYVKGEWNTEVKPYRPTNPRGWVVAERSHVEIISGKDCEYRIGKRLLYDKINMSFSVTKGNGLFFLPDGAFLVAG